MDCHGLAMAGAILVECAAEPLRRPWVDTGPQDRLSYARTAQLLEVLFMLTHSAHQGVGGRHGVVACLPSVGCSVKEIDVWLDTCVCS